MDCPFCSPEIENSVFDSSGLFYAIYNIAPILPGHSLVIPKKHVVSIIDLTDSELSEMMLFTRKVTRLLLQVFNAGSFNWSLQDQEFAGQTIAHLHMHLVPRYEGDLPNPGDWYPKIKDNFSIILDSTHRDKLSDQDLEKIMVKLRSAQQDQL